MRVRFVQGAFAPGAVGISLIKGIEFKDSKPILISDLLAAEMKKVHPLTMLHPSPCHTPHHAMLHPSPRYTPHHATPLTMLHHSPRYTPHYDLELQAERSARTALAAAAAARAIDRDDGTTRELKPHPSLPPPHLLPARLLTMSTPTYLPGDLELADLDAQLSARLSYEVGANGEEGAM